MFDGLSMIASVITIVEVVSQAVRYARSFCRASEEFRVLQVCFMSSFQRSRFSLMLKLICIEHFYRIRSTNS